MMYQNDVTDQMNQTIQKADLNPNLPSVPPNSVVVIITNNYFPIIGGISTYVGDLCAGLKKNDCAVKLFYPNRKKYLSRIGKLIFVISTVIKIYALKKHYNVVINSHSANFCLMTAVLCKKFYGSKVIHTYHTPINKRFITGRLTKYADALVYVSNATRQLYNKYGVKPHNSEHIIPGGIDTFMYSVTRDYSDRPKTLLFVGRICKEKGVIELIQSINKSKSKNGIRVSIVGDAQTEEQKKYMEQSKKLVKGLGLTGVIEFKGRLVGSDLLKVYQLSDIFVCPSIWEEPAPMVIAEALSAGLPVIAFDTGGLRERIKDGVNGVLVERENIDKFADTIDRIVENADLYIEMSKNAVEYAQTFLGRSVMVRKYLDLYTS